MKKYKNIINKKGGQDMQAIVYYPKNCNYQETLAQKVAVVHAEAILRKLQTISCPKEQKDQIIKDIINDSGG